MGARGLLVMDVTKTGLLLAVAGALSLGTTGCKEDEPDGSADETGGEDDDDDDDDMMDGVGDDDDDDDCVPGAPGCVCASGDTCSGVLFCVEDTCVMGPQVEFEDEYPEVLAGLRIPVEVTADGETIMWSQSDGPSVELVSDVGTEVEVDIPADLSPGDTFTLMVEASLNGVTLSDTLDITIREPVFSNVFPDVTSVDELGTVTSLAFRNGGMYVASAEGFVSQMTPGDDNDDDPIPPGFGERYDVGGIPGGMSVLDNDRILIANSMLSEVQTLNTNSGNIGTLFDSLDGGDPMGEIVFALVDRNRDDVVVSNMIDGQLIYHDSGDPDDPDDPEPPSTYLLGDGFTSPNAMAFGPEGGGMIYLGVQDAVVRVPYDEEGIGMIGTYLDLAGQCGVPAGIAFDDGANMWVTCPETSSLFVARYVGGENPETEVSVSWSDVGTDISTFTGLRFGGGDDWGGRTLYWTSPVDMAAGTVGSLGVGLGAFND